MSASDDAVVIYQLPNTPRYAQESLIAFIFITAFLTYCCFYDRAIFYDGDSPWHIIAGDYIRAHGIPKYDPFGATNHGFIWYNMSWMYDVFVSIFHQFLGVKGLVLVNAILAACIPASLAYVCFQIGAGMLACLLSVSVAILMTGSYFTVRPQLPAILVLVFAYYEMLRWRRGDSQNFWKLPLYTLLLVNIHGSFLVLLVFGGAYGLEFLENKEYKKLKRFAFVGLLCVLATLINPVGFEIYNAAYRTLGGILEKNFISEWQPALITTHPHIYFYIIAAMAIPMISNIRLKTADKLLIIFWTLMTIKASRYNAVLLVVMTPFLAAYFQSRIQNSYKFNAMDETVTADFASASYRNALWGAGGLGVMGAALLVANQWIWQGDLYNRDKYPVAEIGYLMQHQELTPVLNYYDYGGMMIYQSNGALHPFIDGRAGTAYPTQIMQDYKDITDMNPGWQESLAKYSVHSILVPNSSSEKKRFEATGWHIIYTGNVATILKEKNKKPR